MINYGEGRVLQGLWEPIAAKIRFFMKICYFLEVILNGVVGADSQACHSKTIWFSEFSKSVLDRGRSQLSEKVHIVCLFKNCQNDQCLPAHASPGTVSYSKSLICF